MVLLLPHMQNPEKTETVHFLHPQLVDRLLKVCIEVSVWLRFFPSLVLDQCFCFLHPPQQEAASAVAQAHRGSGWDGHKQNTTQINAQVGSSRDAWRPHRCKQAAHHDFGEYRMFWQLANNNGLSLMLWIPTQQCNHRIQLNHISSPSPKKTPFCMLRKF